MQGKAHVSFLEKGTSDGDAIRIEAGSWTRECATSNPVIHRWALLPVLASGSIKEAPLEFDMLDDIEGFDLDE